ncbi:related to TFB3 - TFIIH subunit (transcription/repair factor) [Cephalotrichum gorgonifer]|uniref:RNA polymerase II transcription factor B subunit 3 n=1 Tax=Cephalotrichum gorgonifer TaxID=2041049 RepID=A0AAE8MWS3_9PEZI|nr:related to TFB3 - TFIIH subunit (transcription/repair factor) [Cephalotrichum gorgonifer]
MLRKDPPAAAPMRTATLPSISGDNPAEDICPVCKTSRYLNRDLEFLIHPDCYHPMCTNCVNRIFREGPNQCPYAGCYKTLRRRGFRPPWFNDLSVERECDIRKRVAAVFNKVEEDFETLADYNDYLEKVEDLTDALVNGGEERKKVAERELMEWEAANKAEIEANKKRRGEQDEMTRRRAAAEEAAARQRRLQAIEEDREERGRELKLREEMISGLAQGETGHAKETLNRIMLKRRGQAKQQAAAAAAHLPSAPSLSIRGLKGKKKDDDNLPYDPFGGMDLAPTRYEVADEAQYRNEWLDTARTKNEFRVGGYAVQEYVSRVMFEAFSGLGVFIEDEKADEESAGGASVKVQTGGRMEVDDVF